MKKIPFRYRMAAVIFVLVFYGLPHCWFINFRFDRYGYEPGVRLSMSSGLEMSKSPSSRRVFRSAARG